MPTTDDRTPVFYHPDQLLFRPLVEWERGKEVAHPETPERLQRILEAVEAASDRYELRTAPPLPARALDLHAPGLLALYRAAERLSPGQQVLPTFFPGPDVPRRATVDHVGQWATDTHTPLGRQLWRTVQASARAAAAAEAIRTAPLAYAATRPPGHHATPERFGGYCYLNHAALAARILGGRVTILDIDVHHGHGTQAFFERDPHVQVVSVHEHPAFPWMTGHAAERGEGPGIGLNANLPQASGCDGPSYLGVLEGHVLPLIRCFEPDVLVISAGVDTHASDPLGSFQLTTHDLHAIGCALGRLGRPTVVLQEGGYDLATLGASVIALLDGLREGQSEVEWPIRTT